jgi:transposase
MFSDHKLWPTTTQQHLYSYQIYNYYNNKRVKPDLGY